MADIDSRLQHVCIPYFFYIFRVVLLRVVLFFNITTTKNALYITTIIPHHTYSHAGIKINTPGYSVTNAQTDCLAVKNNYCLFSVSDKNTKTISIAGSIGEIEITLCLNTIAPISCQIYRVSIIVGFRDAYVANDNNTVLRCPINFNGTFGNCADSGNTGISFSLLRGIVLNATVTKAYVVNGVSNTVSICPIKVDRSFGACVDSNNTGTAFVGPEWMALR